MTTPDPSTEVAGPRLSCGAVQVLVLGPLEVHHDGAPIELRRGRSRALLSVLALHAPDVVPSDVLIERLWGDHLPANPGNALQLQVSYLRRALAAAPGGAATVVTEGSGYRLAVGPEDLDLRRFQRLADRARRPDGGPSARLAVLDEALALWRGEPLPEVASLPWSAGEVTRLQELRIALAERRIDALVELGRSGDAIIDLGALIAAHPLNERFHAQLMLCLYRAGRQSEALRVSQSLRSHLMDELGLDVGPEIRALEGQILDHDPVLVDPVAAAGRPGAAAPRPVELRRPLTSLIGREEVVARVCDLLAGHRLLTLTGPGGSGKTRVAVEAARQLAAPDRLFFVDLGAVGVDDDVFRAIADRLGIPTTMDEAVETSVVQAFAGIDGLLVLDTCEHVVDRVAALVDPLLARAPGLTVLATSRRPLGLPGELAWPVGPLSLPAQGLGSVSEAAATDAVTLFCERARAVRPDFVLDEGNVEDVVSICHAVDGLPLAIELAAAHADVLGPGAIRSRLSGRFELLRGHRAAGPERHRALRATIDWSVDLLEDDDRAVFDRLSVFAGSFDLDAAGAVADVEDPLPPLASLVRQSLVTVAADDRYRLLDSVRTHVASSARCSPADLDAARGRHAAFYVARARQADRDVRSVDQLRVAQQMERDAPEYRAALRWLFGQGDGDAGADLASSLAWMWTVRGNTAEADHWLALALGRPDLAQHTRIRTLLAASMVAAPAGALERARDLSRSAAELAETAGLPLRRATALLNGGVASWALGDLETSASDLQAALALFRSVGSDRGAALSALNLARTTLDREDVDRASALLDAASSWLEDGDPQLRTLVLAQRAKVALHVGEHEAASRLATAALAQAEDLAHHETIAASLHVLGSVHVAGGRLLDAASLHRRALAVAAATNHVGAMVEAIEGLAAVEAAGGRVERAATMFAAAAAERDRRRIPIPPSDSARLARWRRGLPTPEVAVPFRLVVDDELSRCG